MQQQGIETLSQILLVITPSSSTVPSVLVKEDFSHEVFWSNLKRLQQIRKRLEIGKKKHGKEKCEVELVSEVNQFLSTAKGGRSRKDGFVHVLNLFGGERAPVTFSDVSWFLDLALVSRCEGSEQRLSK